MRDTVAPTSSKECPLCNAVVAGGPEGMNRHFETECPWRHTSKSPLAPATGKPSTQEPPAPKVQGRP